MLDIASDRWQTVVTPNELEDNMNVNDGFLLEGMECYCDDEARCENHDNDAEAEYWYGQYQARQGYTLADLLADGVYDEKPYKYETVNV